MIKTYKISFDYWFLWVSLKVKLLFLKIQNWLKTVPQENSVLFLSLHLSLGFFLLQV